MVEKIQFDRVGPIGERTPARTPTPPPRTSFSDVLQSAGRKAGRVTFSAHAMQRLKERGVTLDPVDQDRIQRAVDRAAAKGANESLLMMDGLAMVVSVSNRTVITVAPAHEMEDMVFTNIDSAVVVAARAPLPAL